MFRAMRGIPLRYALVCDYAGFEAGAVSVTAALDAFTP